MVYLKIGNTATSFTDVANGISIVGDQVAALPDNIKGSSTVKAALASGYLILTTKTDYDTWAGNQPTIIPTTPPDGSIPTRMLTDGQISRLEQIFQAFS